MEFSTFLKLSKKSFVPLFVIFDVVVLSLMYYIPILSYFLLPFRFQVSGAKQVNFVIILSINYTD